MSTVLVDSKTQRFSSGPQPDPEVVVEHTTEVMAWPPYANGGEAPHATIWPIAGQGIRVREHIPFTQYAKALMNLPGGVETNRRGVIQFELVGTCNPAHRGDPTWYFWPDADDVVLAALADYQRPIMQKFGIPFAGPAFLPYPASYGQTGVRMSGDQWTRFKGVCGHQHVPENDHGDPGAFPIGKFLAALRSGAPSGDWFDMATQADLEAVVRKVTGIPAGQKALDGADGAYIVKTIAYVRDQLMGQSAAIKDQIAKMNDPAAIAAAIPDNLAQQVVDQLAARLKGV